MGSGPSDAQQAQAGMGAETLLQQLRDPTNFEFGESSGGDQLHIVATGVSPAVFAELQRKPPAPGTDEQKAICGVLSEFDTSVSPPTTIQGVIESVCSRCISHSHKIQNKGKFSEVTL